MAGWWFWWATCAWAASPRVLWVGVGPAPEPSWVPVHAQEPLRLELERQAEAWETVGPWNAMEEADWRAAYRERLAEEQGVLVTNEAMARALFVHGLQAERAGWFQDGPLTMVQVQGTPMSAPLYRCGVLAAAWPDLPARASSLHSQELLEAVRYVLPSVPVAEGVNDCPVGEVVAKRRGDVPLSGAAEACLRLDATLHPGPLWVATGTGRRQRFWRYDAEASRLERARRGGP